MSGFDTMNANMELTKSYSGRYFVGKVVNNTDPLNLDRVQATVPNLYDKDLGELPWIGPVKTSPFGIGATWGVYGSPNVGSDVLILLQDGDPHYPLYHSIQTKKNDDFPTNQGWGFKDFYGNKFRVASDKTVQFIAVAGATFNIAVDGSISVTTVANQSLTVQGNSNVAVTGNSTVGVTGNATINVTGNTTLTSPNTSITSNVTINGTTQINGNTNIVGNFSTTGTMTNNSTNVGSGHVHSGIAIGPYNTGGPT
jgi:hypothetical protein